MKNNKEELLRRRRELEDRAELLKTEQTALKILLNSLYGATSNEFFRYYDIDFAEAITLSGQAAVRTASDALNDYLNKATGIEKDRLVAGDTDSCYVCVNDVIEKVKPKDPHAFLVKFCNEVLSKVIQTSFERFFEKTNGYKNTMSMKLEKISSRAVWQKKKRYILYTLSSEGVEYSKPKVVIKGLEAVKSSIPKFCRDEMKKLYEIVLTGTEQDLQKEILDFKDNVFMKSRVELISIPSGTTDIKKWEAAPGSKCPYLSRTPINSRAAILYNHYVDKLGLGKQLEKIVGGDRMKYVFLRPGNPTGENVIGYIDKLPIEFDLHKWVDYEALYDKTFRKPLNLVLTVINWNDEYRQTLDDFFV